MNLSASIPLPIQRFIQRTIPENVREAIAWCLPAWGISRLALIIWATVLWALGYTSSLYPFDMIGVFYYGIKPINTGIAAPLIGTWLRWDTVHYVRIAQSGYTDPVLSGFFPLYALLGRVAGWLLGGNDLLGLLLVANLALYLALVLLYILIQDLFSSVLAQRTIILLLAAPGGFFFFAAYPHSLLLLYAVAIFMLARKKRWFWCTVVGLLAGLTHSTGAILAVPMAAIALPEWWTKRSWRSLPLLLTPLAAPLGVALFLAWQISHGLPDFSTLQQTYMGMHYVPPWEIVTLFFTPRSLSDSRVWINLSLVMSTVAISGLVWKKLGPPFALFTLTVALVLGSTGTYAQPIFNSYFRFMVFAFPFSIGLALWTKERYKLLFLVFATLQLLLSGLFIVWGFVG